MEHDFELALRNLSHLCSRGTPVPEPRDGPFLVAGFAELREALVRILLSAILWVAALDQITAQAVTRAFASNPLDVSAMEPRARGTRE